MRGLLTVHFLVVGGLGCAFLLLGVFVMLRPDRVRRWMIDFYSRGPRWFAILNGVPLLERLPLLSNLMTVVAGASMALVGLLVLEALSGGDRGARILWDLARQHLDQVRGASAE